MQLLLLIIKLCSAKDVSHTFNFAGDDLDMHAANLAGPTSAHDLASILFNSGHKNFLMRTNNEKSDLSNSSKSTKNKKDNDSDDESKANTTPKSDLEEVDEDNN